MALINAEDDVLTETNNMNKANENDTDEDRYQDHHTEMTEAVVCTCSTALLSMTTFSCLSTCPE